VQVQRACEDDVIVRHGALLGAGECIRMLHTRDEPACASYVHVCVLCIVVHDQEILVTARKFQDNALVTSTGEMVRVATCKFLWCIADVGLKLSETETEIALDLCGMLAPYLH